VCQDSHLVVETPQGWLISAVADGVGSASKSDAGSKTAVEQSVGYLRQNIGEKWCQDQLQLLLKSAFRHALDSIIAIADDESLSSYDTTLTVALYNGSQVVFGHSGDGGIVVLKNDGLYDKITEEQKGDEAASVHPLRFEHCWVFDHSEDDIAAFALMTDGILDCFCPSLLKAVEGNPSVDIHFAHRFMDINFLEARSKKDFKVVQQEVEGFLRSHDMNQVTDDMTIVIVINTAIVPRRQQDSYYARINWESVRKKANKNIYGEDWDCKDDLDMTPESNLTPGFEVVRVARTDVESKESSKHMLIDVIIKVFFASGKAILTAQCLVLAVLIIAIAIRFIGKAMDFYSLLIAG
jgi:serine/threonine protein phosphatase PrpC